MVWLIYCVLLGYVLLSMPCIDLCGLHEVSILGVERNTSCGVLL